MPDAVIPAEALVRLVRATFMEAGCSEAESLRIGTYLVRANLTGHDSHGVIRVPRYLQWMREDGLKPGQSMTVITESDVMAVVDGSAGFGQTIGPQAVKLGIEKAHRAGAAVIALRRSGHLGRIGDWAEMAVEAGQVSIHLVNVSGSILVAPFGAAERRMSTNPVAIGVPVPGAKAGSRPSMSKLMYTGPSPSWLRSSAISGVSDLCQHSSACTTLNP